jgi:hypothetical protein
MKTYGGMEIKFYTFLTSPLDGGLCACSATGELEEFCPYWELSTLEQCFIENLYVYLCSISTQNFTQLA